MEAGRKNRRAAGSRYEEQAAAWLEQAGLQILERNYRCRQGEIDLIALDGETLVFVEVKYRSGLWAGSPEEAVDRRKQNRIRTVARYYLYQKGLGEDLPCRFDVVGILGEQIHWIRDAF